jgi:threonine dehydrogenase-like Zn-dependent dehydrogenase
MLVRDIGRFELSELPAPTPGQGAALIEVAVTGPCRTDLKLIEAVTATSRAAAGSRAGRRRDDGLTGAEAGSETRRRRLGMTTIVTGR